MSVDILHALMAGVFVLVWLLVWQILVRGQQRETNSLSESTRAELDRPHVTAWRKSRQSTRSS